MSEILRMQVYGAWLFRGKWDGKTPPPGEDWKLLRMQPGRFDQAPKDMLPKRGQVLLLMHGEHCDVLTATETITR